VDLVMTPKEGVAVPAEEAAVMVEPMETTMEMEDEAPFEAMVDMHPEDLESTTTVHMHPAVIGGFQQEMVAVVPEVPEAIAQEAINKAKVEAVVAGVAVPVVAVRTIQIEIQVQVEKAVGLYEPMLL
jgi:hypothetical protein